MDSASAYCKIFILFWLAVSWYVEEESMVINAFCFIIIKYFRLILYKYTNFTIDIYYK